MSRKIQSAFAVSSLLVLTASLSIGCFSGRHKTPEATQENFGVNMARMNLWREALFRFKRAAQMKPNDAMAHNNLAVAYEANGDFDNAAKEYREAMRLDKSNMYIQKNYSRFVEFNSRNKKRQKPTPAPKTASASTTPTAAVPVTTTAVPEVPVTSTAPPPPPTDTAPPAKPPGESR
ncbi:MAG TPA: tetratricopeptide repeat protein [Thermoanaerobaculia bacterium]